MAHKHVERIPSVKEIIQIGLINLHNGVDWATVHPHAAYECRIHLAEVRYDIPSRR